MCLKRCSGSKSERVRRSTWKRSYTCADNSRRLFASTIGRLGALGPLLILRIIEVYVEAVHVIASRRGIASSLDIAATCQSLHSIARGQYTLLQDLVRLRTISVDCILMICLLVEERAHVQICQAFSFRTWKLSVAAPETQGPRA